MLSSYQTLKVIRDDVMGGGEKRRDVKSFEPPTF